MEKAPKRARYRLHAPVGYPHSMHRVHNRHNLVDSTMTTGFEGALSRIVSQTQEEVADPNGASDDSYVSSGEEYREERWEAIQGYSPTPRAVRRRKKNRDLAWVKWHDVTRSTCIPRQK